jgi:hypothetical protein
MDSLTKVTAGTWLRMNRAEGVFMSANEPEAEDGTKARWLTRNVFAIGLLSLFSDAGHELTTAILPLFLATLVVARPLSASSKDCRMPPQASLSFGCPFILTESVSASRSWRSAI